MNLVRELIALLAPPGCVACGRALASAAVRLCADCVRGLPWLRGGCPRCGLPKHGRRGCPATGAAFPRAWAPMAYQGVARRLVAALKFRSALVVADVMAAHMAANLPPDLRRLAAAPGGGGGWPGGAATRGGDGWPGGAAGRGGEGWAGSDAGRGGEGWP